MPWSGGSEEAPARAPSAVASVGLRTAGGIPGRQGPVVGEDGLLFQRHGRSRAVGGVTRPGSRACETWVRRGELVP